MKQLIFILVLFSMFPCSAQTNTYQPYPNGWGASWLARMQDWQGVSTYVSMEWSGDTTINTMLYTKVYSNGTYIGGVRQNIANEEAYFINELNTEYNIAFDPNKSIGDTVFFHQETFKVLSCNVNHALGSLVIDQIDSTMINGSYRKVYHLYAVAPGNSLTYEFTTGVGFTWIQDFEYAYDIRCHYDESTLLIGDTLNPFCIAGINELSSPKKELIKITDLMGRETTFNTNTPLIYIYSDGTIEKVYTIK